jgi:hypothetical protein
VHSEFERYSELGECNGGYYQARREIGSLLEDWLVLGLDLVGTGCERRETGLGRFVWACFEAGAQDRDALYYLLKT